MGGWKFFKKFASEFLWINFAFYLFWGFPYLNFLKLSNLLKQKESLSDDVVGVKHSRLQQFAE